uniref:Uncharacterized protein n=1 Tax=Anguilla anguilla TaxID=7936 RepID=A0A0E9WZB6_ANGAN
MDERSPFTGCINSNFELNSHLKFSYFFYHMCNIYVLNQVGVLVLFVVVFLFVVHFTLLCYFFFPLLCGSSLACLLPHDL